MRTPSIDRVPGVGDGDFAAKAEAYVLNVCKFYSDRANWHRRLFQVSALVLIGVGAGLPVLASLDYPHKQLVISVAGALVAGLTALRAFYLWDQRWVLLRKTEISITTAYWNWRAAVAELTGTDEEIAIARNQAVLELLKGVLEIRENEAKLFFESLSWPRSEAGA